MEKNAQIEAINLFKDSLNNRPCKKHDEDHTAIRSSMKILLVIVKKLEEMILNIEDIKWDEWKSLADLNKKIIESENNMIVLNNNLKKLGSMVTEMQKNYPEITTMKKSALLIDGDNIIDTVDLESWRYLKVQYINPADWNDHAKLDAIFSWEVIEVTDWKYDINIPLGTDTEWETATMTVNIDLLFIKY